MVTYTEDKRSNIYRSTVGTLTLIVVVVCGYVAFVPFEANSFWDSCYQDRYLLPKETSEYHKFIFWITQGLILLVYIVLLMRKPVDQNIPKNFNHSLAFVSLVSFLWFIATYMIIIWSKEVFNDTTCSTKANRFSNNFIFFRFFYEFFVPFYFELENLFFFIFKIQCIWSRMFFHISFVDCLLYCDQ